jgi:3D (Asp-Asp-Asp) domain-containing protein
MMSLAVIAAPAAAAGPDFGKSAGKFKLTYYWLVFEKDCPGRPSVPLYRNDGTRLAMVSEDFATKVNMEGTGVLRSGTIVNLASECKFAKHGWCFMEVDRRKAPFGYGSAAPLKPFRTLAAKDEGLPIGRMVYVKEFDGLVLPTAQGGFEYHDGCFVVQDTGWSLDKRHIDMFVLEEAHYKAIDEKLDGATKIEIFLDSPLCPDSAPLLFDPQQWMKQLIQQE